MPAELTNRERDVMRVLTGSYYPCGVARLLNLRGPWPNPRRVRCDWCPVGKVARGQLCAPVPRSSRGRVTRVLASLVRKGLVVRLKYRRKASYLPKSFLDAVKGAT